MVQEHELLNVEILPAQIAALEASKKALEARNADLEAEVTSISEWRDELASNLAIAEQRVAALTEEAAIREEEKSSQQRALGRMAQREEEHHREMQAASMALEASRTELARALSEGEEERTALTAKIIALEQRLMEGDSNLREQLHTAQAEKFKLESTLKGVKVKVHKLFAEQQDQHKVGELDNITMGDR
jgi:chromosome segregation ATPase